MRNPVTLLPAGAWAGLVIIGLGAWARDLFGVALGGVLAITTLVLTDRQQAAREAEENAQEQAGDTDITQDERFKDL